MTAARRARRDIEFGRRLQIGQRFRRRGDGMIAAIRQVHRQDSVADLATDFGVKSIAFVTLRTEWDELVAHDHLDGVRTVTSWVRDHQQLLEQRDPQRATVPRSTT